MKISHYICLFGTVILLDACVNYQIPSGKKSQVFNPVNAQSTGNLGNSNAYPIRISHIAYQEVYPDIMMYAMSLVGTPYTYGGNSRVSGFDCSGLVLDIYQHTVHIDLPRTARDMAAAGIPINKDQLKIGDLVFFNTNGRMYSHVGIYLGNDRFLHSPNSHSVVRIESLDSPYWHKTFSGARTYFVK